MSCESKKIDEIKERLDEFWQMHWYSVWVKKMRFSCFPYFQVVQKHASF